MKRFIFLICAVALALCAYSVGRAQEVDDDGPPFTPPSINAGKSLTASPIGIRDFPQAALDRIRSDYWVDYYTQKADPIDILKKEAGSKEAFAGYLSKLIDQSEKAPTARPEVGDLETLYSSILDSKDLYNIFIYDAETIAPMPQRDVMTQPKNSLEATMDAMTGGVETISPLAENEYHAWLSDIHNKLGKLGIYNMAEVATIFADTADTHDQYVARRNLSEYLLYCPSSPMRSADPHQYFFFFCLADKMAASFKGSERLYARLANSVSAPLLDQALHSFQAKYTNLKIPNNTLSTGSYAPEFHTFLLKACRTSGDDRLWALCELLPDENHRMKLVESWEYAKKQYDALLARDGEGKLLGEIHDARAQSQAYISQKAPSATATDYSSLSWPIRNHLSQIFLDTVHIGSDSPNPSNIQVVYNLADQAQDRTLAWISMAEGPSGSILVLRNADDNKPPEIIRFDVAQKQIALIKSLDQSWWKGPVHSGIPASLYNQDGVVYGAWRKTLLQMNLDGSNAKCRKLFKVEDYDHQENNYDVVGWDGPSIACLYWSDTFNPGFYWDDADDKHLMANLKPIGMADVATDTIFWQGKILYFFGNSRIAGKGAVLCRIDANTGQGRLLASFPGTSAANAFSSNLLAGQNNGFYIVLWAPQTGFSLCWMKTDGSEARELRRFTTREETDLVRDACLVQGSDGWIYWISHDSGTSSSKLCRISPDGTRFETIYKFGDVRAIGARCAYSLLPHVDGCLYGVASNGGRDNKGTLFKIIPDSTHVSFDPPPNGVPALDLVLHGQPAAAGNRQSMPSPPSSTADSQAAGTGLLTPAQGGASEASTTGTATPIPTPVGTRAAAFNPDRILRSCLVRTPIGNVVSAQRFKAYNGRTMDFTGTVARMNYRENLVIFRGGGVFPLNWDVQLRPEGQRLNVGQTHHMKFLLRNLVTLPLSGYSFRGDLLNIDQN